MSNVDLQQLIQALDAETRRDLESSAERCVARGGSKILVEDLLLELLERPQGLLSRALQDAEVDAGELSASLQSRVEHSASRNPVFAPELVQWLQDALLVANLELGQTQVEQAALILALLRNPMRYAGSRYQPLLAKLNIDRLKEFALSQQEQPANGKSAAQGESLLERFTHNLTQQARDGKLDPVLCRDGAIRQMVDILARRRKNNPIVVGEAGVGKTAIVEGLASRIAAGEVPQALKGVELLSLDMGLLQAGASVKGEFERRLKCVIDEVKASPKPIILFIDEAHTLIGAGGNAGGSDAANLLKPALARGELRTIAATTWAEYKKYFEKDPALARRFQPVQLHEPTVSEAVTILRGLAQVYEKSHGIYLRDDAVVAAAELSARYLAGRQLPDKAVDVLDTACARVRISLAAAPESLERLRGELAEGGRQRQALRRDAEAGLLIDHEALEALEARLKTAEEERAVLEALWLEQKTLAERLLELRQQLAKAREAEAAEPVIEIAEDDEGTVIEAVALDETQSVEALTAALNEAHVSLVALQVKERLVSFEVCPRLVAEVISAWTGVPLAQLAREHNAKVASFAKDLRIRIRGQEQAVHALDRSMRATAAGLNKPDAPVGVFLLVGPSGVGKTETALALADLLYGGDRFITTINMSEFQEKHTVSRLIGAPPGYVGYGEGGMLTEAVRQKPYSVVLLDEVEKADPDVLNLFYQIFDKGVANDGEGREIDFRNTLILMTSNLGSDQISALCEDGARPTAEVLEETIRPVLSKHFKPALLARMRVVPYYPVSGPVLRELIEIKLGRLGERLNRRQLEFTYCQDLVDHLAQRCTQSDSGARLIDHLLDLHVLPLVADRLLDAMASGESLKRVHATLDSSGSVTCEFA
ncbi:type VI secretion system ATPase TssH [Pseudomonas fragariae (ex Marin et al. 2024)]|uniref:Type VI secretion system ATPase TssH n=2 Tax=Pseudomonas fragariae (ex Marin et al. 2024) TaxID=3080056 RepID=A0ABT3LNH3_9PSED|nr:MULTISPECIES: type VI secretion system ATPase TssH [unclassified Pseudomonas]MCW6057977.1 type VI secretion system ATPase TssH [Pseudomonas fragi]MDV0428066.1 type VI secretion system ATPase TssH [Pseudomonas sp. 17]MDX9574423.1 type VI secretion system ATPase TssH [Pseudomonas sp. 21(2023)]MDX9588607.1 type VI secretion system ATPase TssH [Pseudomonas sp. 19(2023)]MDX9625532.1 type VI secretion system ATPase TssH [Pseudomonas sp. 20]